MAEKFGEVLMLDEKLHPEVEAQIQFLCSMHGGPTVGWAMAKDLQAIALLAASKAREEERERCAKVCDALASRLEDRAYEHRLCADKSVSNSDTNAALYLRDAAVAIRRGKP